MVAHQRRDDPLSISPADGIDASSAVIVNTAGASTATGALNVDNGATATGQQSAPPLAPTLSNTPVITTSAPPAPTPTDSTPVDANAAPVSAASAKPIALSTVIGSCVGAFIGAAALILLGLWFYRRYSQSLNKRRPRGPQVRNGAGNDRRRRSHLEPWNKLEEGNGKDDGDDKWEGMYQAKETKEADQVAPMEKLTMFKKTPSVRTAYTHRSTDVGAFDFPASYADFDPKLAEALTASQTNLALAQKPTITTTAPPSDNNAATNSLVSVNTLAANNASRDMAIPTPPPTVSQLHRWESAEVVQPQPADSPTTDTATLSPPQNPFFDLKDNDADPADENGGVYARGRSPAMPDYKSPKARGKERMRYSDELDPFDDLHVAQQLPPKPAFVQQHSTTASTSSTESKEKALQSLMAALELPEDEVRNRLRIASMQPSFISRLSSVAADEDEDVTIAKSFPLPPSESRDSP